MSSSSAAPPTRRTSPHRQSIARRRSSPARSRHGPPPRIHSRYRAPITRPWPRRRTRRQSIRQPPKPTSMPSAASTEAARRSTPCTTRRSHWMDQTASGKRRRPFRRRCTPPARSFPRVRVRHGRCGRTERADIDRAPRRGEHRRHAWRLATHRGIAGRRGLSEFNELWAGYLYAIGGDGSTVAPVQGTTSGGEMSGPVPSAGEPAYRRPRVDLGPAGDDEQRDGASTTPWSAAATYSPRRASTRGRGGIEREHVQPDQRRRHGRKLERRHGYEHDRRVARLRPL